MTAKRDDELERLDVRFVLVRAKQDLQETLARTAVIDRVGLEHIYPTLPTLVEAFRSR